MPQAQPGTRIRYFGDYEILQELGHGGMGVVFKARQVSLNRLVAVKLIQGGEFASPRFVERFRVEAEAAARLQHPNIVAIHEVGEHEGQHYFSMDYVEGPTLEEQVRKGPLAPKRAAALVGTIAEAIHYAHGQGILHRDLKPSNVLVDLFDQPRITDFGLAKVLTGDSELTLSGQPLGSPGYMAPEQAAGKPSAVGPRSDVYALGAVLYHLLAGRAPFHAETLTDVLRQVRETDPVRPRVLNPSVPRDLETICLKCLEKESQRRYRSAQELRDELNRFLEDKPILARPVSRPERLWRWCRRQPVPASLTAALVLVVTLGLAGVTGQWQQAVQARQHAERLVYADDMQLAFQAINNHNLKEARRHLTNHWPEPEETDLRSWEWRYLWQRCQSDEIATLGTHAGGAGAVAYSPDGRWLASGGEDQQVKIWDLSSGSTAPHATNAVGVYVCALAFSPDSRRLAVGGWEGIELLDARTWGRQGSFVVIRGVRVDCLRFSPDGDRLVAANNAGIGVWQMGASPKALMPLPHPDYGSAGQRAFALAPDGSRVAHVTKAEWPSARTHVIVRDLETSVTLVIRECTNHQARTLAWSPDGKWLVLALDNGTVEVYDANQLGGLIRFGFPAKTLPTENVYALAFSPDGGLLAAGGLNGRIEFWDTATWRKQQTLTGHQLWITDMAFSPDPNTPLLATTSGDGTVRSWSLEPKEDDLLPFSGMPDGWDPNWETGIHLEPEGSYSLRAFAEPFPEVTHPLPYDPTNLVTAVTVGPRAEWVAFALQDHSVHLWDRTDQGQEERWSLATQTRVDRLHSSPNGKVLFGIVEGGGMMWIRDVVRGREIASATNSWSNTMFYLPQFTADQRQLAIPYGSEGQLCLWDFADSKKILLFEERHTDCNSVALSPDGETLATVNKGGSAKLWDVKSRRAIATIEGRGLPLIAVTFSPDGKRLITGGEDEIKVWDVKTRREVGNLVGGTADGWPLRFQDRDTLLVLTTEGILRLHAPSFSEITAREER